MERDTLPWGSPHPTPRDCHTGQPGFNLKPEAAESRRDPGKRLVEFGEHTFDW